MDFFSYFRLLLISQLGSYTYTGFSKASGSSRPSPAGFFSASSTVKSINSASTFP